MVRFCYFFFKIASYCFLDKQKIDFQKIDISSRRMFTSVWAVSFYFTLFDPFYSFFEKLVLS